MSLAQLFNKYIKFSRGKRLPKFVTGIKILPLQGGHLTLHLDVVLSHTYGGADEASSVLKLDTLSFGKIVIVFFNCCTVHFDKVQNSFHQQIHPLLNI